MSFFKMPFRLCPSGCGHFLSADDGHDHCLKCLGFQHTEDAFMDDSCAYCGRMSMTSLRSRLSFLKGLAPSTATRAGFSGSSRGPSQKPLVHLLRPHYPRWQGCLGVHRHSPGGESDRGAPVPMKRHPLEEPSASPVQSL